MVDALEVFVAFVVVVAFDVVVDVFEVVVELVVVGLAGQVYAAGPNCESCAYAIS